MELPVSEYSGLKRCLFNSTGSGIQLLWFANQACCAIVPIVCTRYDDFVPAGHRPRSISGVSL